MSDELTRGEVTGQDGIGVPDGFARLWMPHRMAKKIVNHTNQKVPFMLLAGDRDVEADAVSFRFRDRSQLNGVARTQAVEAIVNWIENRENASPSADVFKPGGPV